MYELILLLAILLIVAYLLRNRLSTDRFRQRERSLAAAAAIAAVIGGLMLVARLRGFEPKLGAFIGMLGILTLIAKQQAASVLHTLRRLGIDWNPFTHRLFSPVLGWPLFFMGLIIATPPALWVDLIGVVIVYAIAISYARWKKG